MSETDFRADYRAISLPALIVHGTKDVSAPIDLTARPTAALIRNSRL
ncbi:MAG: alpha/beta fold hydrolase [Acetobacteraceae bacterium]